MATGHGFGPYAEPVFNRCVQIVHHSLLAWEEYHRNPELDEPDRPFLIVSLDLLSGLVQGLGGTIEVLIARSNPPLLPLVGICLKVGVPSMPLTRHLADLITPSASSSARSPVRIRLDRRHGHLVFRRAADVCPDPDAGNYQPNRTGAKVRVHQR